MYIPGARVQRGPGWDNLEANRRATQDLLAGLQSIQAAKDESANQQFLAQLAPALQSGDEQAMQQVISQPHQGQGGVRGFLNQLAPWEPSTGYAPMQQAYLGQMVETPIAARRAGQIERARYDNDPGAQARTTYYQSRNNPAQQSPIKLAKQIEDGIRVLEKQRKRLVDEMGEPLPGKELALQRVTERIDQLAQQAAETTGTNLSDEEQAQYAQQQAQQQAKMQFDNLRVADPYWIGFSKGSWSGDIPQLWDDATSKWHYIEDNKLPEVLKTIGAAFEPAKQEKLRRFIETGNTKEMRAFLMELIRDEKATSK